MPFFAAQRSLYASFYPEVAELQRGVSTEDEPCFDILILAGSVLHPDYGDVAERLRQRAREQTGQCVRVHNLAEAAHTSLDSLIKYQHLGARHFDLVVLYHGINEVRANNCPADQFREDYSHFAWYKLIHEAEGGAASRWWVLPYTVKFVALKAAGRLGFSAFLPIHEPDAASLAYGCDVKTIPSFRRNVEGILALAAERRETVLLMTFAYYLPEDYSAERFQAHALDYGRHTFPVALWGRADCVGKGLEAHSDVIRSLAGRHRSVLSVDQNGLIPKGKDHFDDVCHLAPRGCERFVENMLPAVTAQMARLPNE